MEFPRGANVILKDSKNDGYFYLVKSGKLEVQSDYELDDREVGIFDPGETFGLVSALTNKIFLGNIVAIQPSVILRIPVSNLGSYVKLHRESCIKMMRSYSQELRSLDRTLSQDAKKTGWSGQPENLLLDADIYLKLRKPELASYALARFCEYAEFNPDSSGFAFLDRAKKKLFEVNLEYKLPQRNETVFTAKKGEPVFLENEKSEYFYIIRSGQITISRIVNESEFILAILGPGEIFGELSVLDEKTRMASAIAHSDAELMRLGKSTFMDQVGEKVLQKLFESMARRIWYMHQRLSIMSMEDASARVYNHLHMLLSDIRMRTGHTGTIDDHEFNFSVDDLRKMVGAGDSEESELITFFTDPNIIKGEGTITVHKEALLQDKIYYFRKKSRRNVLRAFI